jgi:hypothetical protein
MQPAGGDTRRYLVIALKNYKKSAFGRFFHGRYKIAWQ